MQYNLIKKIIESGHEYKRVVNLTGTDYPVVSNARLMEYWLDESVEYIWGYNLADDSTGNQMRKVSCFHYMDSPKIIWKAIRSLDLNNTRYQKKYGYNYYFGSEYWALSLDVLKKTLAEWDSNKDLQDILRRSFAPSEIWIHTLFFNSTFRNKGKLVEGEYKGLKSLSPLMYFDYKDKIQVLNEDYYERIIDSGKLFARKFVIGKSDKLKQMIDYRRMQT